MVGVAPAFRALNNVIAVEVPLVPIVLTISGGNIVLRVIRVALNCDSLIPVNTRAALWRRNLGRAFADIHDSFAV
jgi:hypothetical protein